MPDLQLDQSILT